MDWGYLEIPTDEENVARFIPKVWAKEGIAKAINPARRSGMRKIFTEFTNKEKSFSS
jgi:hypothetical protein